MHKPTAITPRGLSMFEIEGAPTKADFSTAHSYDTPQTRPTTTTITITTITNKQRSNKNSNSIHLPRTLEIRQALGGAAATWPEGSIGRRRVRTEGYLPSPYRTKPSLELEMWALSKQACLPALVPADIKGGVGMIIQKRKR